MTADQQPISPGATDPRIEAATDAITYHPGNRTGTPDTRHPVSLLLAQTALAAADAADRAAGIVRVDTRDEAVAQAIAALEMTLSLANAGGRIGAGTAYDIGVLLTALQSEQP